VLTIKSCIGNYFLAKGMMKGEGEDKKLGGEKGKNEYQAE
jgi:hypothetical protein